MVDENFGSRTQANRIISKPLSTKEFESLTRCSMDPFYFASFIYVINAVKGRVPFKLYPYQRGVLWSFIKERFNIILKFRQAGITELIALFCLWYAMFHSNKTINIISIKDTVAKKVLRKIKFMYRNLPEYMKVDIINGRRKDLGTGSEMEFANGSMITSIPTTEEAGRSESLSLLVIDEAAIIRWADQIWAAAFPTLSTGGRAILNSCITGDTRILGKNGYFRVDMIAPKEFGKHDVQALGLEVMTHQGRFKKVLGAVNKGVLKTWEVENRKGKILKATPAHKLLTTRGWKTIKEITEKGLNCIFSNTDSVIEEKPITKAPKKEVKKDIIGYTNYQISNLGKIYYKDSGKEKKQMTNNEGYKRVSLWRDSKSRKFKVTHLVASHFIGAIPEDYVVDHIDNTRDTNHVNNLQIITRKENAQRANKYNHTLNFATRSKGVGVNYEIIGYILEKIEKYGNSYGFYNKVVKAVNKRFGIILQKGYISRIVNRTRNTNIYISKLKINRKFKENIYDICVEDDESYITDTDFINHNTPYGIGNFFHKKWVEACSGGNEFTPIRLKWRMHPDRGEDGKPPTIYPDNPNYDPYWYNKMSASLGPRRTAQEIDGDFLTSGASVFDLMDIRAIEESLDQYIPLSIHNDPMFKDLFKGDIRQIRDKLHIFEKPDKRKKYTIGSDVATGRSRDYSAFTIMDAGGEEAGCFKMKIPVNELSNMLARLGMIYNRATLAPESNDIGLAVSSKLQEMNYPNLHYSLKLVKEKKAKRPKEEKIPGWYTTSRNRPVIIAELEEDIRLGNVIIKDAEFVQEAYTFIYDDTNKPIAMGKGSGNSDSLANEDDAYVDDAILGKAITNHVRKIRQKGLIILPQ